MIKWRLWENPAVWGEEDEFTVGGIGLYSTGCMFQQREQSLMLVKMTADVIPAGNVLHLV